MVRKADNIDLYSQILDLQQEALELVEENIGLKNEIRELKIVEGIQEKLEFRENRYYLIDDEKIEKGPFCSSCWDTSNKLIRLHEYDYYIACPACDKST